MSRVSDLVSLVGSKKYDGSSMAEGVTYQNIPSMGIPSHRGKSDWRARRICELVDVRGKSVLDLGCSVGTMSAIFKENGASHVLGVDHDRDSINLAREVYRDVEFAIADINDDLIRRLADFDVVVWTSQFMWMVKQHGMEPALDMLFEISKHCKTLVFETAGESDGMAGAPLKQEEVFPLLVKNTCFQSIKDCGPWGDEWATRNVFVCSDPALSWDTNEWTKVERLERRLIAKTYKAATIPPESVNRMMEINAREVYFINLFKWHKNFPQIVSVIENGFIMKYAGMRAGWIPGEDYSGILAALRGRNVVHRDIRPENVVWDGTNCVLLDFSYAIHGGDVTNYHYDLGGSYRCQYGFNDEFSLQKTQMSLMQQSLERGTK